MKRIQGTEGVALIECVDRYKDKWRVRWDVRPNEITEENPIPGVNYMEHEFSFKPTIDQVQEVILAWFNQQIDQKILTGFVWRDMPVWLSTENQFNYKAAFDLAAQTSGQTLPVKFKLSDGFYFEFTTVADLMDFYTSAMAYIQATLNRGWTEKDTFDFAPYEAALN